MSSSEKEEFIYRVSYILTKGKGKNKIDTPVVADWLFNEYDEKFALVELSSTLDEVSSRYLLKGYHLNLVSVDLLRG